MKFTKLAKQIVTFALSLMMVMVEIPTQNLMAANNTQEPWLLSKNRRTYASSENGTGELAVYATDGKMSSKWQAASGVSNQWITVDLGASADVSKIILRWHGTGDYAQDLEVLVSDDEITWESLYRDRDNTGGEEVKVYKKDDPTKTDFTYKCQTLDNLKATGRYVKIYGRKAASSYGISLRELEIYGVGGINKAEIQRNNLSLGKETTASSYTTTYGTERLPMCATDGDEKQFWVSESNNDEWLQVDLGAKYKVGMIELEWHDKFARMFEIQTSLDAKTWTTVYRETGGIGEDLTFNLYQDARYVRMQGVAQRDSGYSIQIFNVYEYVNGEPKTNPKLPEYADREVVKVGKGSYLIDQQLFQPREAKYVTKNIGFPIPSNDWWTSIVYTKYSDGVVSLPLIYSYSSAGLSMYCADKTYTNNNSGGMGSQSKFNDITVGTSSIINTPSASVDGYGDWSVSVNFSDDDTPKLRSTLLKGSPFVYNTFADRNSADITVCNLVRFYDDDGNTILKKDGDYIVTDHFGIENTNKSKSPETGDNINQTHYYGVFAPEGTKFVRSGDKIKIFLGNNENYLNIGVMNDSDELSYYYQYAYSTVSNTVVSYEYDESKAIISSNFKFELEQKRTGANFKNETLTCLFPHQWKNYDGAVTKRNFDSIRGTLKVIECQEFTYGVRFGGIVPTFTEPKESEYYDKVKLREYINSLEDSANFKSYWTADPYWQGKKTHKLTVCALIAQELGDYQLRDKAIGILKKILQNWLTYDGEDDVPFYMYYHVNWGALSGDGGDHGMAKNLTDHHFLWAYYIYPAAVVASYDKQFMEDYGGMIEMLIRDCMNPDKDDEMFPFMRNFDPYEGHSWAGGYGNNSSGNNQESSSEGTYAWAGLYLWGLVTGQDKYRDAGIWGYTSEVSAIEQYWFDYDDDVWDEDYTHGAIGMTWGAAYTYGTYFGTKPSYIYGIQMLPVTPTLCYFGEKPEKAKKVWSEFCDDQELYEEKQEDDDPSFGWYHIMWPFFSQSNPEEAAKTWIELEEAGENISSEERLGSYWFVQNMVAKGTPSTDVWASNYTSYQAFKKGDSYNVTVWNPYSHEIKVEFADKTGSIGYTRVAPNTTVNVNPYEITDNGNMEVPDIEELEKTYNLPGLIQAENYYTNYGCSTQKDSQVGNYVGYIDDGNYTIYQVDVAEAGDYIVDYNVKHAKELDNQSIALKADSDWDTTLSTVPVVGDNTWHIISGKVHLNAGKQLIRLVFNGGGYNVDYLRIYKEGEKPPTDGAVDDVKADLSANKLISAGKPAVASSTKGSNVATKVTDGDFTNANRWESEYTDPQWITIDLESVQKIGGIKIYWQTSAAKNYEIQISDNNQDWKTVFTRVDGDGGNKYGDENRASGLESIKFESIQKARYVRIYGTVRKTNYGYSIHEFQIFAPAPDQKEALEIPVVKASKSADDAITVKWNSIAHAKEYIVYRANNDEEQKKIATTSSTSYVDEELANGNYTYWVIATPDSDTYMNSKQSNNIDAISINNNFPVESIVLNDTSITVKAGETYNIIAEINPTKATDKTLTWTSSDRDVATVRKGEIYGASEGTVTITVTASNGVKAVCEVKVLPGEKPTKPSVDSTTKPEDTTKPNEVTTGNESGSEETTSLNNITIKKPTKLKLKAMSGKKIKITFKLAKAKEKINGYEIRYAVNKKFKKSRKKIVTYKKFKKAKRYILTKVKKNKTYFVKVRAFRKVNGVKVYSKYCKAKKVKVSK